MFGVYWAKPRKTSGKSVSSCSTNRRAQADALGDRYDAPLSTEGFLALADAAGDDPPASVLALFAHPPLV